MEVSPPSGKAERIRAPLLLKQSDWGQEQADNHFSQ
jgi:hypothetical protein